MQNVSESGLRRSVKRFLLRETGRKAVMDVVLYGSMVRGKPAPRDIDIVILLCDRRDMRIAISTALRRHLETELGTAGTTTSFDVKAIMLDELFDPSFTARTGILVEGKSLLTGKPFCERAGLNGGMIFTYSLEKLKTSSEKVRFTQALMGRGKRAGVIDAVGGIHISRACISVPVRFVTEFEEFLNAWKMEYTKRACLTAPQ